MTDYLPGSIKHLNMLLGEQLTEGEGGGGGSWQTVFEGSVTTEEDGAVASTTVEDVPIMADTIKVTFNGVEYECEKYSETDEAKVYGAEFDDKGGFIWTTYPFCIVIDSENIMSVYTPTAGTYTLKIEEPQSGGSSDFSTAEVAINASVSTELTWQSCPMLLEGALQGSLYVESLPATITVPLYNGKCVWDHTTRDLTLSGNIEELYEGEVMLITGDCAITIAIV